MNRRAVAVASATGLLLLSAPVILAASPSPSGPIGGDPRSSGQGPGLVGDPVFAILVALGIGLAAVLGTLLWVRLTRKD